MTTFKNELQNATRIENDENRPVSTNVTVTNEKPTEMDCFTLHRSPEGKQYGQFSSFCFGEDDHIYVAIGDFLNTQGGIAKVDKSLNLVKLNTIFACNEVAYCYGKVFTISNTSRTLSLFTTELEFIRSFKIEVVDGQRRFRVINGELYYLSKLNGEWNLQKIDEEGVRTTILNFGIEEPSDFRELYGSIYVCIGNKIKVYDLAWTEQAEMINNNSFLRLGFENNPVDCLYQTVIPDATIAFSAGNLLMLSDNAIQLNVNITEQMGNSVWDKDQILYGACFTSNQYVLLTSYGNLIYVQMRPEILNILTYTNICPIRTLKYCLMKDGNIWYSYGRKLIRYQIA